MECSCAVDICDDYDTPSVFNKQCHMARKEHTCCECHRKIKTGENYEYVFGVWDHTPSTHKTCNDCLSFRNQFFENGYYFEQIWDDFRENFGYIGAVVPESCIAALTPRAREKVCEFIEEQWEREENDH